MASIRSNAVAVAVVVTLSAGPAAGWNDAGHKIVARLAYAALDDGQRRALVRDLEAHPRFDADFTDLEPRSITPEEQAEWLVAHAATWPDLVRRFDHLPAPRREALIETYDHARWHYVNIDLRIDGTGRYLHDEPRPYRAPGAPGTEPRDVIEALEALLAEWRTLDPAARGIALCWVLHLVGDVHQPLHTTTLVAPGRLADGDRGGNDIHVLGSTTNARNLHALWDGALGGGRDWQSVSRAVAELGPVARLPARIAVRDWAYEARAVARDEAYTAALRRAVAPQSVRDQTPEFAPDAEYLAAMRRRARAQALLAAGRLVVVLEALGYSGSAFKR